MQRAVATTVLLAVQLPCCDALLLRYASITIVMVAQHSVEGDFQGWASIYMGKASLKLIVLNACQPTCARTEHLLAQQANTYKS